MNRHATAIAVWFVVVVLAIAVTYGAVLWLQRRAVVAGAEKITREATE